MNDKDLDLLDILAIINFFIGLTNFSLNDGQQKHLDMQDEKISRIEIKINKILKILEDQNGTKN